MAQLIDLLVCERYSWPRAYPECGCTDANTAAKGPIEDSNLVTCVPVSVTCSSWSNMNTQTSCTDYSTVLDVGSYHTVGVNSNWYVANQINTAIRADGYLNTSSVAVNLPIIYKEINITHVHVVQMSDLDVTNILKWWWSVGTTSNFNGYNECRGVCSCIPGANLIQTNCTILFTLTVANQYAAVVLQIEDYFNSGATTSMSSVPLQFLFYGYPASTGCTIPPVIIGNRANQDKLEYYRIFFQ